MTVAALLLGVLLAQGHGTKVATGKRPARGAEAPKRSARARADVVRVDIVGQREQRQRRRRWREIERVRRRSGGGQDDVGADGKTYKSKTYNFGAMDVEGKLKTPQLLYFLNRVKLELDMSAPDTRSFMKELEKSADDKNL